MPAGASRRRRQHRHGDRDVGREPDRVRHAPTIKTIAVTGDTLLVDEDGNDPDVQSFYTTALTGDRASVQHLGSRRDARPAAELPAARTRTSSGSPATATRARSLPVRERAEGVPRRRRPPVRLRSGHPRPGGRHDGVRPRLPAHHLGRHARPRTTSATGHRHAVAGSPVTDAAIGDGAARPRPSSTTTFEDQITPNGTAPPAFTDDARRPTRSRISGTYKVVFLAFPMEEYGTAADKADLLTRVKAFFGA